MTSFTEQLRRSGLAMMVIMLVMSGTAAAEDITVVLLGTGSPRPVMDRFGPSIFVQAGTDKFVFDVGRGAAQRLLPIGVPFGDLSGVFLTHLHSDHVVGLPDLWLSGWLSGRRATPLIVWGPAGTKEMTDHLQSAYKFDVAIRIADDKLPAAGGQLLGEDISEAVVFDRNKVKVTAFLVDHRPIELAFGYRIDFDGHSVVLSGDTRFSENLIRHAKGADLLVHEVSAATPEQLRTLENVKTVVAHHTTPEEAAEVFRQTAPKLAVYSHIVLFAGFNEDDVMRATREHYTGAVVMGADLMRFIVGNEVKVEDSKK